MGVVEEDMKYRAAAKSGEKLSEPIRLWTNRGGDVYFGIRATAQSFKISFHASGECHEGIHREQFERMEESGLTDETKKKGRIWHQWHRPINYDGVYPAFSIILPSAAFRDAAIDGQIENFDVGSSKAAIFTLYFARVKSEGTHEIIVSERELCTQHQLPNGEWVILTFTDSDLPEMSIPKRGIEPHNFSNLADIDTAIASGASLRAMVFANIQKGDFNIPCLIETSIDFMKDKPAPKETLDRLIQNP